MKFANTYSTLLLLAGALLSLEASGQPQPAAPTQPTSAAPAEAPPPSPPAPNPPASSAPEVGGPPPPADSALPEISEGTQPAASSEVAGAEMGAESGAQVDVNPEGAPVMSEPAALVEEAPPEAPPAAPSVLPLAVSGSFFSRYELRQGYGDLGLTHPRLHRDGDTIVYRARFGVQTNPLPIGEASSVLVKFVPQAAGTHATGGAPPTVGDAYVLGVYEAFTRLQSEGFYFDVGRFMMDYGDALVIGNLGWHESARAFQGARMRLSGASGYYTDVFATLITEGSAATGGVFEGDRVFYGVYTGLGPALGALELDLYLLGQSFGGIDGVVLDATTDPPTTGDQESASFFTLGARIKQTVDIFDYRAEAGLQFGTTPVNGQDAEDKFAYHADGGIGLSPVPGLRIGVGGLVASGDSDPADGESGAWDELFPTSHKFLGQTDVFGGRTNALSGNADVSYKAMDALVLKLEAHLLARMEDNAAGESFTGSELNAHAIHTIGSGMVLRGMYGAFLPNEDFWGSSDAVHFFELSYGIDFK